MLAVCRRSLAVSVCVTAASSLGASSSSALCEGSDAEGKLRAALAAVRETASLTSESLGAVTFGGGCGFCTGYALKKAGRASAVTFGIMFVGLQAVSSLEYISVNWSKIEEDVMDALGATDGKLDATATGTLFQRVELFLTKDNGLATASFSGAFLLGFTRGSVAVFVLLVFC